MASEDKKIRKLISKSEKQFAKSPTPQLVMSLISNYKKLDQIVNAVNAAREGLMKCANSNMIKVALASLLWEYEIDEHDEAMNLLEEVLGEKPDNLAAQKLLTTIETTRTGELRIADFVELKSSKTEMPILSDSSADDVAMEQTHPDEDLEIDSAPVLDVTGNLLDVLSKKSSSLISDADISLESVVSGSENTPEPDEPFEDFHLNNNDEQNESLNPQTPDDPITDDDFESDENESDYPVSPEAESIDTEQEGSMENEIDQEPDSKQEILEGPDETAEADEEFGEKSAIDESSDESDATGNVLEKARECLIEKDIDQALELYRSILEYDPENTEAQEGFRVAYAQSISTDDQEEGFSTDYYDAELAVLRRQVRILDALQTAVKKIYSK